MSRTAQVCHSENTGADVVVRLILNDCVNARMAK